MTLAAECWLNEVGGGCVRRMIWTAASAAAVATAMACLWSGVLGAMQSVVVSFS